MAVPKVAAIHDLSGLGKCSLTAAIPILSVCGVQAVPLATAVLSNQTSFEHYVGVDLSEHLPMIADQWQRMDLRLDGIFTGYLSGVQQVEWVSGFLDRFRRENTLVLVDPVLGENGEYYRGFDEEMRCAMRGLCRQADIITPNLTEALMLLGKDARQQNLSPETAKEYARELAELGPKTVIITGIGQGETVWNVGYDAGEDSEFLVGNRRIGGGYSGTGDILSSVVCGCMVRGESAHTALERAARLLEASIAEAVADGSDPNEGIAFEHHLKLLMD